MNGWERKDSFRVEDMNAIYVSTGHRTGNNAKQYKNLQQAETE